MKKVSTKKLVLCAGLAALLIVLPLVLNTAFSHHVMTMMCIWALLGMGWNIIGGYAGQISNGHAIYYAFGAYANAMLLQWFNIPPWIAIWIGCLFSASIAFLIGKGLLRFHGHVFAIATMAVAECARLVFINTKAIGGATGVYIFNSKLNSTLYMQFSSTRTYVYLYIVIVFLVLMFVRWLDKTKFCYYLRAINGNETAAESAGIDAARYKLLAYMLSAVIVSFAGGLYMQFMLYTDPSMILTSNISMMIVLVTVMGGVGTVYGPIIGAIVLTFISEYTRVYLSRFGGLDMVIYGLLVILIVLFIPDGLISIPRRIKARAARKNGKEKGVPTK